MASVANLLPYGFCPVVGCKYSKFGTSASGNKLSCSDHARLHAIIDHGFELTQLNESEFDNSDTPFKAGTKATTRLNPRVDGGTESILKGLEALAEPVASKILLCPGD